MSFQKSQTRAFRPKLTILSTLLASSPPNLPAVHVTSVTRSRQSFMGPTASSRAKITQSNSVESLNVGTSVEVQLNAQYGDLSVDQSKENIVPPSSSVVSSVSSHPTPALSTPALGNHSARAALRLDLLGPSRASLSPMSLKSHLGKVERAESPRRQALVTPTEMRSLGKECRKQIVNIEQSLVSKTSRRFSTGSEMLPGTPQCQKPVVLWLKTCSLRVRVGIHRPPIRLNQ